jgi:uncharacterized repeat protein (TIGR03803 family)
VVFSFNVSTHMYKVIHAFSATDGALPEGKLLASFDGNLYGTTTSGGAGGVGEVFEIGGVLGMASLPGGFQEFHSIR